MQKKSKKRKEKKKDSEVNVSNFETYTRYFGVADEKQKKNLRGRFEKRVWETLSFTDNLLYEYKNTQLVQYNKLLKMTT